MDSLLNFSILTREDIFFMLRAVRMSLGIAAVCLVAGTILGTIGAAGKLSKNKLLNGIATVYVEVFRGTPMMMQITFAFLALPGVIRLITGNPIRFDPVITGAIAISLNSGAYSCELIRSGILEIDHLTGGILPGALAFRQRGPTVWPVPILLPGSHRRLLLVFCKLL